MYLDDHRDDITVGGRLSVYFRLLRDLTYSLLHTDDWVRIMDEHGGHIRPPYATLTYTPFADGFEPKVGGFFF